MAKKKKVDGPEEAAFEFPEFDEEKFLRHEFEQTIATALAFAFALLAALVSFGLQVTLLPIEVPAVAGLAVVIASPFLIRRLRAGAQEYTKGDWAALLLVQIFGWLGFWFVLSDVVKP